MSYQQLEDDVNSALSRILSREDSGRFRCHETARLLRDELEKSGYENVIVRDGKVQYNIGFLVELMNQEDNFFGEVTKGIFNEKQIKGNTKPCLHSWCEIGDVIAEYNSCIEISSNLSLYGIEIVKKREELVGKAFHFPCGREFSMNGNHLIYFPPFYFTKLNLQSKCM